MTDVQPTKQAILLVDDEPEILFSLQGLLRREFELYTAADGQEALRILQHHPIHVIMTDQRMPQMTGVELMSRVRTEYPDAMRIIFTGYADIKAVIDAVNHGDLYRYITKPWDPDDLIAMLHAAAAQYDAVARRRSVLADLWQHVAEGQRLVAAMVDQQAAIDSCELRRFLNSGRELLDRRDPLREGDRADHPTIMRSD